MLYMVDKTVWSTVRIVKQEVKNKMDKQPLVFPVEIETKLTGIKINKEVLKEDDFVEERKHDDVLEHRHASYPHWHPAARVHTIRGE